MSSDVSPDVSKDVEPHSDDERWLVVDGRRWRRQDPLLPDDVAATLKSHLGRGRSRGERRRTDLATHGLGERGTPWWEQTDAERRSRWDQALTDLAALD